MKRIHVMREAGRLTLTLDLSREGDQWTGVCREVGTAACADTRDETIVALADLIVLHLKALGRIAFR